MTQKNINRLYPIFHVILMLSAVFHSIYYRRFKVSGRENIPAGKAVIFAANHQNALMDALAVIFAARRQIVFLARADIFRKKPIANLLRFIRILPVYRIRDGYSSLGQNQDTFNEVNEVLMQKIPVGIFPEGFHLGMKKLKPLSKGIARMAFQAMDHTDFKLDIQIVPVGLDYSNYFKAGSDLLVIFGKPISVVDYREMYRENPAVTINQLRDDLAGAMKEIMIDINQDEYYKPIYSAIEFYGPIEIKRLKISNTLLNLFTVKKRLAANLISQLPKNEALLKDLHHKTELYEKIIAQYGLKDRLIAKGSVNPIPLLFSSLITLLLLPLHLYGMLMNYLPYSLPVYLARKIKDRHFLSSVKFGAGLIFFFTWYFILAVISFFFFDSIILNICFIISLPLTGVFSFYYYIHMLRLRGKFRWLSLKIRKKKAFEGIVEKRKDIMQKIEEMLGGMVIN